MPPVPVRPGGLLEQTRDLFSLHGWLPDDLRSFRMEEAGGGAAAGAGGDSAAAAAAAAEAEAAAAATEAAAQAAAAAADKPLGPAGEKALKEERDARAAAEKRAKAAEKALEDARKAQMTDSEKALDAAKAEGKTEADKQYRAALVRAHVIAAAGTKLTDPEDAARMLDLSTFELGDDMSVDTKKVSLAIDELIKQKPYLAADGRRLVGNGEGGARRGSAVGASFNDIIRQAAGRG